MARDFGPLTPGDAGVVAARVSAVLDDAWRRLAARQRAVLAAVADPRQARQITGRLAQFQAAIDDFRQRVDTEARAFVTGQLPHLYEQGAQNAAHATGGRFTWTLLHAQALQSLASDTYADFLARSQEEQRMASAFYRAVRAAARREIPLLAAGNMTARQAARQLAQRLAAEHQLRHVVYRNGTRMPVQEWAEMATLTKSAVAYNTGTLNRSREAGVEWVEVFDGLGCGWTTHTDPDKATGTLRTVEEAASWPISHPRCRRGFGPRPDVDVVEVRDQFSRSRTARLP
ncbi:phage minor capsid protein [Streptomyces sp. NPDC002795]|uniref:phage minor capsid protein n=1 Tax=Streptomyces sp. NPDC002795 TaxID=3364665 RepID=UPI00369F138A